jgi:hypothetical protein
MPGSWLPGKTDLALYLGGDRMSLLVSPGPPLQTVDDRMPGRGLGTASYQGGRI